MKTKQRRHSSLRKTRRQNYSNSFESELTSRFFEMLFMVKLFHWKTHSYSIHKATDNLYSTLNDKMDRLMEILLGKHVGRMNFGDKEIKVSDYNSPEQLKSSVENFKQYLESYNAKLDATKDNDILNLRDELLGELNKFLYLLTLQ